MTILIILYFSLYSLINKELTVQKFYEIMFDCDPLELAEEMVNLEEIINVIISTDEEAEIDDEIFFGLPTDIGEVIEIKAKVNTIKEVEEDLFELEVSVIAVDAALQKLAIDTLLGKVKKAAQGEPMWASGFKQQDSSYAILANSPGGILTAEQLAKIAELSAKGAGYVKLTHAQRVVLLMKADQLEMANEELISVGLNIGVMHHGIRNIRACCGSLCRFAQQTDGKPLSQELASRLYGRTTAFDIKIAISDCMRNCSESYCADIGAIAEKGTYKIVIGGRGSQIPFRALNLVSGIKPENLADAIEEIIEWYTTHADHGERLHKLLLRLGEDVEIDLTSLDNSFAKFGDGVDETTRTQEQLKRTSGMMKLQEALSFCN